MMKSKKKYYMLFAVLMVAVLFAGCGKKKTEEVESETEAEIEEEAIDESSLSEDGKTLAQVYEFYSDNESDIKYNFPEEYTVDGKTYALVEGVTYEVVGTKDVVQSAVEVTVEDLESIADTYTYTSDSGVTYELTNDMVYISSEEKVTIPVEDSKLYEFQVGQPSVASTKTITYYDTLAGEDRTITGTLSDLITVTAARWEDNFEISGTFLSPSTSTTIYVLEGTDNITVSRYAETPVWDGYETDVLDALGLSSDYYIIDSASWDGDEYIADDGRTARDCIFSGSAYVADYKAIYTAERTANAYTATVYYRTDADSVNASEDDITVVYQIKAVANYELVE